MPSTIRGSDNFDTAGGNAVKAWVNFNGTGTVAIRAQYNVSSITDNGTGQYTVNFTNALTDANYSAVCSSGIGTNDTSMAVVTSGMTYSTTALNIHVNWADGGANLVDYPYVNVAIFR